MGVKPEPTVYESSYSQVLHVYSRNGPLRNTYVAHFEYQGMVTN